MLTLRVNENNVGEFNIYKESTLCCFDDIINSAKTVGVFEYRPLYHDRKYLFPSPVRWEACKSEYWMALAF